MKKLNLFRSVKFAVLSAMVALATVSTGAAASNTATANASASIVTPISISSSGDLKFGQIVASATQGTVVLTPAGSATSTGGVTVGNASGRSAAIFTVSGNPNSTYAVTLPQSPVTITSATDATMTVDTFTSSGTGTLDGSGTETITVGATLNVGASQNAGDYTGQFSVSVAYN